jgi:hypothetical protein
MSALADYALIDTFSRLSGWAGSPLAMALPEESTSEPRRRAEARWMEDFMEIRVPFGSGDSGLLHYTVENLR